MNRRITGFRVIEQPYYAVVCPVPGLTLDMYDQNGQLSVEKLLIFGKNARSEVFTTPYDDNGSCFFDLNHLLETRLNFTSSHKLSVSNRVYRGAVLKHTLEVKVSMAHIGTSSLSTSCQIFASGIEEPLCEETTQFVTVDKETHKPIPLPQWYQDKYKGKTMLKSSYRIKPKPRPHDTVTRKVTVQWTDTDVYNHCTFSTYSRYAMDSIRYVFFSREKQGTDLSATGEDNKTIVQSGRAGLTALTESVVNNGLKQLEICFLKECLQGDVLDTHLWLENGDTGKVNCSVCRDDVEVCQMSLEFFHDLTL